LISKYGRIKIGINVFIGCKSTVLPNVTIGNNCIVGACSVVTKDIPKCAIVGGNPARIIKYRDINHYYNLKAKGKFS
jgi:acetyltransferase-like isoleucine patch superfamily enzyme